MTSSAVIDYHGFIKNTAQLNKENEQKIKRNIFDLKKIIYKPPDQCSVNVNQKNTTYGCSQLAPTDMRSMRHDAFEAKNVYKEKKYRNFIDDTPQDIYKNVTQTIKHKSIPVQFGVDPFKKAKFRKQFELV